MQAYQQRFLSSDISLPDDAGPHPRDSIEWWYYFAFLDGMKGGKYAAMASFFRIGEFECCKGHYLIFSLIDLNKNNFQAYSCLDCKLAANLVFIYLPYYLFKHPTDKTIWKLLWSLLRTKLPPPHRRIDKAYILKEHTRLLYGNSSLAFTNQNETAFITHLTADNTVIDLQFLPEKEVALVGGNGKPNTLFYYSFTSNKVKGRIANDETVEDVEGTGWFDHQWGSDHRLTLETGWNWFGLQLEDGRELLINNFHSIEKGDTFRPMANLIDIDGSLKFTRDLELLPVGTWQSPLTKVIYPLEWNIIIHPFGININVKPVLTNQEMPAIGPLQAIWEGVCTVTGEEILSGQEKKPLQGRGFMELVGYANSSRF